MPTKKVSRPVLTPRNKKLLAALGAAWSLDTGAKKLTGTFSFPRFLDAFMVATRIAVHAEVLGLYPEIRLKRGTLTCIISAHTGQTINTDDLTFATRLHHLLSTKPTTNRRT